MFFVEDQERIIAYSNGRIGKGTDVKKVVSEDYTDGHQHEEVGGPPWLNCYCEGNDKYQLEIRKIGCSNEI